MYPDPDDPYRPRSHGDAAMAGEPDYSHLQPDDRPPPAAQARSRRWGLWDRLGVAVIAVLLVIVGAVVVTEASRGPSALELAAWHEAGHAVVGDLVPDECGLTVQRMHVTRQGSGAVHFDRTITRDASTGECQWADLLMVVAGEEAGGLYADLQAAPEQAAGDKSSALRLIELLRISRPTIVTADGTPLDWDADTWDISAVAREQAKVVLDDHRPAVEALAEAVLDEESLNLGTQRIREIIDAHS